MPADPSPADHSPAHHAPALHAALRAARPPISRLLAPAPSSLAAALALLLAALPGPGARAQGTDASTATAAEIRQAFKAQKTRGLSLVQGTPSPADAPTVARAAKTPAGTLAGTPADAEAAPVAYSRIEADAQVNARISFDFDSAVLRPGEKPKLAALCEAMRDVDVKQFRIVGHTDAKGTEAYNEKLSLLRAEEVRRFLVGECGIDAARLEAVGMGKRVLFDAQHPDAEANRRVEFQALS